MADAKKRPCLSGGCRINSVKLSPFCTPKHAQLDRNFRKIPNVTLQNTEKQVAPQLTGWELLYINIESTCLSSAHVSLFVRKDHSTVLSAQEKYIYVPLIYREHPSIFSQFVYARADLHFLT